MKLGLAVRTARQQAGTGTYVHSAPKGGAGDTGASPLPACDSLFPGLVCRPGTACQVATVFSPVFRQSWHLFPTDSEPAPVLRCILH